MEDERLLANSPGQVFQVSVADPAGLDAPRQITDCRHPIARRRRPPHRLDFDLPSVVLNDGDAVLMRSMWRSTTFTAASPSAAARRRSETRVRQVEEQPFGMRPPTWTMTGPTHQPSSTFCP